MEETLTIKQVAKHLNLSEHTVRCHLYDWGFFRMPNSRVWRIHKSDLDLAKRRADNFPQDCSVGRNKKENLCRSTNEKKAQSGGLILLRQVGKELDALLKQK